jgi:putative nucleotidyltransferase with HDIG domain
MLLEKDVYSQDDRIVPVLTKDATLTPHMIEKLIENGIEEIFIEGDEDEAPLPFSVPRPKPIISPQVKLLALNNLEEFFSVVHDDTDGSHSAAAIKAVKNLDAVVEQLVTSLSQDQKALIHIEDLKSYDEYTYHHSLSVAVISIAIANTLGFSNDRLLLTGRTAILHDIGKTSIPIDVIQKPGRLTDEEFALIRTHSSEGYQYLTKYNIGDEALWGGVVCHHEKYNGTGYPFGFKGEDIPLISRIISVADVYDALTSYRTYRKPMQPHEAVEYVMAGVDNDFDYDIVKAFLKKLELYPVGSFVELSNGRVAAVISNAHAMRPRVRYIDSGEMLDLYNKRHFSLTIRCMLPREEVLRRLKTG